MTTKQYLQQVYFLNKAIDGIVTRLEKLRERAVSISPRDASLERVQENRRKDGVADCVAAIVDLERKLEVDLVRLEKLADEVIGVIERVEDVKVRAVLWERYVMFKSYEEIADEMGYSMRRIYQLHSKGLVMAQRALKM